MKKYVLAFFLTISSISPYLLDQGKKLYMFHIAGSQVFKLKDINGRFSGTGFRLRLSFNLNDTVIVTNAHVCDKEKVMYVETGKLLPLKANVLHKSVEYDLCILDDPEDGQIGLVLAPYEPISAQNINIVGFPGSTGIKTLTLGLISGFIKVGQSVTAPVFPGNSGSPVMDDMGLIVGVINRYDTRTRDGILIPLYKVKEFINEYKK